VLDIPTAPALLQGAGCALGQPQRIVQLATRQEPGVGGDGSALELQSYSGIEVDPQRVPAAFTHQVPPNLVIDSELIRICWRHCTVGFAARPSW
jgi:hypothetical protein